MRQHGLQCLHILGAERNSTVDRRIRKGRSATAGSQPIDKLCPQLGKANGVEVPRNLLTRAGAKGSSDLCRVDAPNRPIENLDLPGFRGDIARTERSAPAAQPYQDLIDQLFFGKAGLSEDEVKALEERYAKML
ncbi:MAG: hypothetical protein ACRELG_22010 [Gemmataceae bacterium]